MSVHYLKAGDTAPGIERTLTDGTGPGAEPVDLSGASVNFKMRRRSNSFLGSSFGQQDGELVVDLQAEIVQASDAEGNAIDKGVVRYGWREGDTDEPGTYVGEFEVVYPDNSSETFPNAEDIIVIIRPDV